jgi:CheY-like chemotaxis protein
LSIDATSPPTGLRVLLVEDEPLIALDGEQILRSMGVDEIVWVRSVAEGMQRLDTHKFDVAFLDLRLGMESSIPLARRLADLNVPFGFITGFHDDAIPPEFKNRPIVPKPFMPRQLSDLLLQLVGKA